PPPPPDPCTIMIGDFDTGILDTLYEGQLISEYIEQCASKARNHNQFVICVTLLAYNLKKEGIITKDEMIVLKRFATRAEIPEKGKNYHNRRYNSHKKTHCPCGNTSKKKSSSYKWKWW
ncbi:MAG: hypothetical protein JW896_15925, partial [Deltaproteobacteria bacterium]|nr:hypothetical protein [Deltaproteobacteria bacterium]